VIILGFGQEHGEETLNGLLDAEANRLCNAEKYKGQELVWIPEPVITRGNCRRGRRGDVERSQTPSADL